MGIEIIEKRVVGVDAALRLFRWQDMATGVIACRFRAASSTQIADTGVKPTLDNIDR